MIKPYYQHILNYNSVDKILTAAPAGWEDFTRVYPRDRSYHGIFRVEALSQRFVLTGGAFDDGGYYFIKDAIDNEGIRAVITYTRKILNPYTQKYDNDYVSILDVTPDSGYEVQVGEWIEVKTIDTSKLQSFKSNDEKEYALESTEATNGNAVTPFSSAPRNIYYPEIDLFLYALTNGTSNFNKSYTAELPSYILSIAETVNYVRTEEPNYLGDRYFSSGVKIYENSTELQVKLKLQLKCSYSTDFIWTLNPSTPEDEGFVDTYRVEIKAQIFDAGDVFQSQIEYVRDVGAGGFDVLAQESRNLSGSVDDERIVFIPAGHYIKFFSYIVSSSTDVDVNISSTIPIDYYNIIEVYESESRPPLKSWLTYEAASRFMQLITGEQNTSKLIYSDIFGRTDSEYQTYPANGNLSLLATIGGRGLRQYPSPKTKTSFKDWFRTIDRMGNIALWYDRPNDRFRIESKEQVYRDEQIFDLGTVSNFVERGMPDAYFSDVQSGSYWKGEYEKLQGALEFNIQSKHSINMPVKDKKDMRTLLNTDSVGAELAMREEYNNTGLTDTKQDEQTFIIDTDGSEAIIFDDVPGGVDENNSFIGIGQYYNGNYTPRKCLINNGNHLSPMFYKEVDGVIRFVSNTKDLDITYGTINESDPITKADLDFNNRLFDPILYDIEFVGTNELITQIDSDPHGYFKFNDEDGNIYYGYWDSGEIADYKRTGKATLIKANINRS